MGLLDNFIQNVGGQEALSNALLGMGSNLLQASGPSTTPVSTGQAIALGIQGFQDSRQKFREEQQKKQLLEIQRGQLQAEMQKRQAEVEKYQRELSDQEAAKSALANYADQIEDPKQKQAFYTAINADPAAAVKMLDNLGGIGGADGPVKSQMGPGFLMEQNGQMFAGAPRFNPVTNQFEVMTAPVPNGAKIIDRQYGQTADERMQTAIQTAGSSEAAVGASKLSGEQVSLGIYAADSIPLIKRSLELLAIDGLKTGGYEKKKLSLERFLGVSGANEEELDNNTGTQLLERLKPWLGGAFTQSDREYAQDILAGFGKSKDGNIRILKQLEKLAKKQAYRGIDAANTLNQKNFAQQIEDALDYRINDQDELPTQNGVTAPVATPAPVTAPNAPSTPKPRIVVRDEDL